MKNNNKIYTLRSNKFCFPVLKNIDSTIFLHLDILKFQQKYSKLFLNDNKIVKIIEAQRSKDYIKRYFNSQAKREYMGSQKLQEIGINTPIVYGYGVHINPFHNVDSVLVMEYIDGQNVETFFREVFDIEKRLSIVKLVAKDLVTIHMNRLHHKDTNMGNIILSNKKLFWIDNDIKKLNISSHIEIALKRILSQREYLSIKEIDYFFKVYVDELKKKSNAVSIEILEQVNILNIQKLIKGNDD